MRPSRSRWQRPACIFDTLTLFHLDKGEPPAFERDEIDLADRRPVASRDDAVAFEAKQKRGDGFREQPVAVGLDALLAHVAPSLRSSFNPSS